MKKISISEAMDMAKYILSILKSNVLYMMSWGFNTATVINEDNYYYGLRFKVNGMKHRGLVDIVYDCGTDTFIVILKNSKGKEKQRVEDVYLDELLHTVDVLVETNE